MIDDEAKQRIAGFERENSELHKKNDILKGTLVFCKIPEEVKISGRTPVRQ